MNTLNSFNKHCLNCKNKVYFTHCFGCDDKWSNFDPIDINGLKPESEDDVIEKMYKEEINND